jgi:Ser/Thr protein kinase RdoA (MazF antagonist)
MFELDSSALDALLREALFCFLPPSEAVSVSFIRAPGSVNNIIRYVKLQAPHDAIYRGSDSEMGDEEKQASSVSISASTTPYVLRLYNNGNEMRRVRVEHFVLQQLAHQTQRLDKELGVDGGVQAEGRRDEDFDVPRALPALKSDSSPHSNLASYPHLNTIVQLSNGAAASLFHLIPGSLPKLRFAKHLGRACGALSTRLGQITESLPDAVRSDITVSPYYDLYKAHPSMSKGAFFEAVKDEAYDRCRGAMDELLRQILSLEESLASFHAISLPHQLIHGDLHYDNILCLEDGTVSGILDFEFLAIDWRVMELAICLSKYAAEPDAMDNFAEFIEGYASAGIVTEAEALVVPDLIRLRILSNVIYFVGRAICREDSPKILTDGKASSYVDRLAFIDANKDKIIATLRKSFETSWTK